MTAFELPNLLKIRKNRVREVRGGAGNHGRGREMVGECIHSNTIKLQVPTKNVVPTISLK